MAVTDLIIKDCDKDFAETIEEIHLLYAKGVRACVELNFAGGTNRSFVAHFNRVDLKALKKVYQRSKEMLDVG